jgi:hypothetical protein
MKLNTRALWACLALATLVLTFVPALEAQGLTSGSLRGAVVSADGATVPGATVTATHVPTGTVYTATVGGDGYFAMPSVRVGGPYTVKVDAQGFSGQEQKDVEVSLGRATELAFALELEGVTETIDVTGAADSLVNTTPGASSQVSEAAIQSLPTVNRSLQDFARTNPYFVVDAQDFSSTRLSVAGRNNRYNSIQIDGAVNNDLFGLADTGTPGGQTDAQPISLDAIEQLQLLVSPYDVRQGGFTGGGINAVTRSGGNEFHGSIFGTKRDADFVGDGPNDRPITDFDQDQYGARLAGPLVKDKFFFFVNAEVNNREQPTDSAADGSGAIQFRNPAGATQVANILQSRYGFDAGNLAAFPVATESDLAFVRFDWNAGPGTQVTLRHNFVDAGRDVVSERSSSTRFRFPNSIYTQANETNSTVAQINSVFGASAFNEARVGFQTIRDERSVPVVFPSIEIGGSGPRNGEFIAGTEQFSTANSLDQDVLEITDDFTWLKGAHTFTFGTHNEIFEFANLFLSSAYGYYYFPTIAAFEARQATQYDITFANGSDPRKPTSFEVRQYGLYVGDQWRVSDRLSVTLGLRADKPDFVDAPTFNPTVQTALGLSTASVASEDPIISPRFGFNWDPSGDGKQQLRGGLGIFTGRTPYVWISNSYGNTGVESTALTCTGSCVPPLFNPDPATQPRTGAAGSTINVNLTDPDFEFPRVLRATLGYDRQLFWGVRGTVEALLSQTQKDVFYLNVNRRQNGTSPLDGRPTYTRVNSTAINDALVLTNTEEGEELTASLQLSRPFSNGLTLTAFYAYQDAESAHDATSSTASSNWGFRHTKGDIFRDDVSRSAFEIENRFNIGGTYSFATGPVGHNVGLYYNAQSGRPYSIMMGGDPNTDGRATNDILFVPSSANNVIIRNFAGQNVSYDVFAAWLQAAGIDPTAGRILDRYEQSEPWARTLDLHYSIDFAIGPVRPELSFDITNLLNMFDKDQGKVEFVSNQNFTVLNYRGLDAATGKPIYQEATVGAFTPRSQFSLADSRSRWQARVGLRVSF